MTVSLYGMHGIMPAVFGLVTKESLLAETPGQEWWRKWQVVAAVIALLVTCGTLVFRAGIHDAEVDGRVSRLEAQLEEMKKEYARRDIIETRLAEMERAEHRIEQIELEQGDKLDELLIQAGVNPKRKKP